MTKELKELKRKYRLGLLEVINDIGILQFRIQIAQEKLEEIRTVEDLEEFLNSTDLESGLKHIRLGG